jgi:hypothetical protein
LTSRELRRLEIDELLANANTGETQQVEAALELLPEDEQRRSRSSRT